MPIVLTCEHYSAHVLKRWNPSFQKAGEALRSHRGWDIGAPPIYRALQALAAASFHGEYSRLLIDLNRSETHPHCFSEFSRKLPAGEKRYLIENVHRPFRRAVFDSIADLVAKGETVTHLSVHTFTPVLNGITRNADIGLLYDPSRNLEKKFADSWAHGLGKIGRVRRNYPYRGIADGHTTALRRVFSGSQYLGIELEVNQLLAAKRSTARMIVESLKFA